MNNVDRDMLIVTKKLRKLYGDPDPMIKEMADIVREQFAAAIRPLIERLRACEKRLAELDDKGGP